METTLWDRTFYISAIVVAAIAGEWFHMISASAEVFFFLSDRTDHSDKRSYGNWALNWSWRILNVRIAYRETSI